MTYQPFPAFADWQADFDSAVVDRYAQRLHDAKEASTQERLDAALTEAMRSAAVDTGAIEGLYTTDRGFTRTVATQAAAWEMVADEKGAHVRRAIEDAVAGYELVLDAVTASVMTVITEAWIRSLHEVMMASQETYRVYVEALDGYQDHPLPRGQYKQQPNNPTTVSGRVHDYAPPSDTPAEMARLTDELRTPEFINAHPVAQAAYAHYAFVCIHPFADGNGRVARALASVFLYRSPGVPLVIFADQRDGYIDALEIADRGDPEPFVRFIAERVVDTASLVVQALSAAPRTTSAVATITSATNNWTDQGLVLAGARLAEMCQTRLKTEFSAYNLPERLDLQFSKFVLTEVGPFDSHYYSIGHQGKFQVSALTCGNDFDVTARFSRAYEVVVAMAPLDAPDLLVLASDHSSPLEVWRREIEPTATTSLGLKIDTWAQDAAARFVNDLNEAIRDRT